MNKLNNTTIKRDELPIRFLQFGEGNFLRAFVQWMIQKSNEEIGLNMAGVIVQPLDLGMVENLKAQDNIYHVILEGIKDGEPIREIQRIDCIADAINPYQQYEAYEAYSLLPDLEFVFSNTTEAGIARVEGEDIFTQPPASFPGKVVSLLYKRYKKFNGDPDKGLNFICCELIENNASTLHQIIIELARENKLKDEFITWVNNYCTFCNSLVDRIVTGFPKDKIEAIQQELGFEDNMVVTAEYYHQWAIEAPQKVQSKLPLDKAGLNIVWTENMKAYRDKKVRILNGAHTALVPVGLLAGHQTVKEAFGDQSIETYIRQLIQDEVIPTIQEDETEVRQFADAILERFFNPYIKHYLKDISLNSLSKWVTRDLPSLLDNVQMQGDLPKRLTFSLAALIVLYSGKTASNFKANDTEKWLNRLDEAWNTGANTEDVVRLILSNTDIWGDALGQIDGIIEHVSSDVDKILSQGVTSAIQTL